MASWVIKPVRSKHAARSQRLREFLDLLFVTTVYSDYSITTAASLPPEYAPPPSRATFPHPM